MHGAVTWTSRHASIFFPERDEHLLPPTMALMLVTNAGADKRDLRNARSRILAGMGQKIVGLFAAGQVQTSLCRGKFGMQHLLQSSLPVSLFSPLASILKSRKKQAKLLDRPFDILDTRSVSFTMTSAFLDFDLVVKDGVVVTASDEIACDIGIKDGVVKVLAADLPVGTETKVINAEGGYVTVSVEGKKTFEPG